ncbi:hypothetical protein [Paenibacillus mucilaginosus]|nr:hypothetical protein [Paenibacillus mucilaginosus]AEI45317.1 hypothetical protein KNP414_06798 [Paenibacillus mucilaginosus KNP414]MCG7212800.1 hypothetical protein [Paenibacillus mucilaginosus]WDM26775.1 hypothetical protein KCX80_30875 [Paenibacillus mucilaginosus]
MRRKWLLALLLVVILAGCGGGPKADVTVFMMSSKGIPSEASEKLQASLQAKLGTAPTVQVLATPVFSMEKMIVEIAAGDHGIHVLPGDQLESLKNQQAFIPLDDVAKPEDFPNGVLEIEENGKKEKHLYVIPMEESAWFKELNLNGKDLYAFIPVNAPDKEKAKQVMKQIAVK